MKKKILLLSPQNVIPATDGGKIGIYMPMQMLAADFNVKAVIFIDTDEHFNAAGYKKINIDAVAAPISKKDSALLVLSNTFLKQPFKFAKYYKKQHSILIHNICENWQPDIVICHHAHLAFYCKNLKEKFPLIQLILREHNVEYLLVQQFYQSQKNPLLKLMARWQFKKTKAFERKCWNYFNDVVFISDDDYRQYSSYNSKTNGHIIYDGTSKILPPVKTLQKTNAILFSGSMRSYQNKINLSAFIETIWIPWKSSYPASADYALWITGDADEHFVKQSLNLNEDIATQLHIHILGFVNNLSEVMQNARFFLSPTKIGAGIRIKLLDALGCSCVTFLTEKDLSISSVLKDGENVLLYSDVITFNSQFEKACNDENFYAKLAFEASKTAQDYFSWQVFYKKLSAVINTNNLNSLKNPNS